jgi:hypothetical protein
MNDERVLERRPLVMDRRARERYFGDGFLTVPGDIGAAWLDRLRSVVVPFVVNTIDNVNATDHGTVAHDLSRRMCATWAKFADRDCAEHHHLRTAR